MTINLTLNNNVCWCEFCDVNIKCGTRYLHLNKKGFKGGFVRINICLNCLKKTLKGKLIIDDAKKKIVTRKLK